MSIILKGIDLPDEKLMEMFESDNHICIGGNYYPLMIKDVIQIPKDHGDIKDVKPLRDKFSRTKSGYCGAWEFCDKPEDMQFLIDDEPTILESEEADEHTDKRY